MNEEVKEAIMQFQTAINFKTATVMPMEYSIDIENAKVLLKYIEQLQQENEHNKYILTEFEKWLEEKIKVEDLELEDNQFTDVYITTLEQILRKLQELKEGKK